MIWIFTAFIVKHFIADFPLQPPYQWMNKGKYGHPGGLLHAAIHGAFTLALSSDQPRPKIGRILY